MPKQRVRHVFPDNSALYDVEVSWAQDKDVQIGIESHDRRTLIDHLIGDAIPRDQLDKMLGNGSLPGFTGLWGSLSRAEVNELIRVLQKARNSAYGADA